MKKTIVYIDAFNLYYGLLKGTANKWLDPVAFSKALLADDHEIVGVKYFTSQIKPEPDDPAASLRQMVYLNALSTLSEVSVIKGFYKRRVVDLPLANEPCRTCKRIARHAHIWNLDSPCLCWTWPAPKMKVRLRQTAQSRAASTTPSATHSTCRRATSRCSGLRSTTTEIRTAMERRPYRRTPR